MCQAVSMLATKSGKIYWKMGIDSHDDLIKAFKDKDPLLKDSKEPPQNTFTRIEISPKNGDYLNPKKSNWQFKLDEQIKPEWWDLFSIQGIDKCWGEWRKWKKEFYPLVNLKEAKKPINPIKIKHSDKVSKEELELLKEWASIRASIGASIWDSIRDSIGASIGDSIRLSIWDSIWDSIGASIRDSIRASIRASIGDFIRLSIGASIWAYIGYLFKGIKKWKYTEKIETKGYPFMPAVKLWKKGLVPSYDGKVWRIHNMNKKAKVIWEGNI